MDTWRIKAKENITKHNKKKVNDVLLEKQCLGVRKSVLCCSKTTRLADCCFIA